MDLKPWQEGVLAACVGLEVFKYKNNPLYEVWGIVQRDSQGGTVSAPPCPFHVQRRLGGSGAETTLGQSDGACTLFKHWFPSVLPCLRRLMSSCWMEKEGILIWVMGTLKRTKGLVVDLLVKSSRFWWDVCLWTMTSAAISNGKHQFSDLFVEYHGV